MTCIRSIPDMSHIYCLLQVLILRHKKYCKYEWVVVPEKILAVNSVMFITFINRNWRYYWRFTINDTAWRVVTAHTAWMAESFSFSNLFYTRFDIIPVIRYIFSFCIFRFAITWTFPIQGHIEYLSQYALGLDILTLRKHYYHSVDFDPAGNDAIFLDAVCNSAVWCSYFNHYPAAFRYQAFPTQN